MRAEAIDYRYVETEQRQLAEQQRRDDMMTPARRAGLDALEREFNDFLKSRRR